MNIEFVKEEKRAVAYDFNTQIGECKFVDLGDVWNIIHTEVNQAYQGKGIARMLVEVVIENSKKYNKKVIADCSYAKRILMNK